jgi:SAM-dependent methyltransferase
MTTHWTFHPHFKPTQALAEHLVDAHKLRHKRIVEIGCGNGAFLKLLCGRGNNTGKGFDPSFPDDFTPMPGVDFVKGYFGHMEARQGFDFLCCRHVLEHIENPLAFLQRLSRMSATSPAATFYFEVPNGDLVLGGEGLWDVIYPHVSYFTEETLPALFKRAGFQVLAVGKTFSGQFLTIEPVSAGEQTTRVPICSVSEKVKQLPPI